MLVDAAEPVTLIEPGPSAQLMRALMKIGITYDLRIDYLNLGFDEQAVVEFDEVETIEAIESALGSLGHQPVRIGGVKMLLDRLAKGDRWDIVFNIAEGMHGLGREAAVPALLDAYEIPYTFSDPLTLCATLHKPTAKRIVRDHGIPTPDFSVVQQMRDIDRVELAYPLFAKPVAEGTSKGIDLTSKVASRVELRAVCERLLEAHRQPVLVEQFMPGREFTVGIIGTGETARALGVMEILLKERAEPEIYTFVNKRDFQERVGFRLASDAAAAAASRLALEAWSALGCRDAGRIDFRCDADGRVFFLEANPLAGLHPTDSDLVILARLLGMSYAGLIALVLSSAMERIGLA